MRLPSVLPDDPDLLEALYTAVIALGQYNQEEFDRLTEARLRAWGFDLASMAAEQLIAAMEESVNRLLFNVRSAMNVAPSDAHRVRYEQVVLIAEQLRDDIVGLMRSVTRTDSDTPRPMLPA